MNGRWLRGVFSWGLGIAFIACGGTTDQAEPTTVETASASDATGGEPVVTTETGSEAATSGWAELDQEARATLMREVVMPRMGTMFREFDGEEFATFTCATCHGDNFQEVSFAMPNGLHPLNPAQIPTLGDSEDAEVVRWASFMMEQVTPAMVEILVVEPYNHETGQGFGCLNCHATAP